MSNFNCARFACLGRMEIILCNIFGQKLWNCRTKSCKTYGLVSKISKSTCWPIVSRTVCCVWHRRRGRRTKECSSGQGLLLLCRVLLPDFKHPGFSVWTCFTKFCRKICQICLFPHAMQLMRCVSYLRVSPD